MSDSGISLKPLRRPSRINSLSGSFKSSFSQAWNFKGQSSSGDKVEKEGSSSVKGPSSLTGHVESHLSDFLLEPATPVQALPLWG